MIKLWVDDERLAPKGWCWARTVVEARVVLRRGTVEVVSLDNDLGSYSVKSGLEGRHVLDFMLDLAFEGWAMPNVIIHTQNPIARSGMVQALKSARRHGVCVKYVVSPAEVPANGKH